MTVKNQEAVVKSTSTTIFSLLCIVIMVLLISFTFFKEGVYRAVFSYETISVPLDGDIKTYANNAKGVDKFETHWRFAFVPIHGVEGNINDKEVDLVVGIEYLNTDCMSIFEDISEIRIINKQSMSIDVRSSILNTSKMSPQVTNCAKDIVLGIYKTQIKNSNR